MKRIRKGLISITAAAATVVLAASLVACGGKKGGEERRSELIGSFESSQSKDVTLTNDKSLVGVADDCIYTSDVYPLCTVESVGVRYTSYQKLRLRRDHTYEYTLEIMVRMVSSQANVDLAKLEASVKGTFEYKQNSGENYTVTVSDPISGDEKRYGSYITGENNIHGWKMSSAPNYKYTVSGAETGAEDFEFDRYIAGKTVGVEKQGTERILYSDMFFGDFLDDIAPYCSYDASAVAKPTVPTDPDDPEKPDKPDEKPSVPSNPDAPTVPERPAKPMTAEKTYSLQLPKRAYADGAAHVSIGVGDRGLSVKLYTRDQIENAWFGNDISYDYTVEGDERAYAFALDFGEIGAVFGVKLGTVQFNFDVAEYLNGIRSSDGEPEGLAAETLAVNILNVAKAYGVYDEELDTVQRSRIFNATENVYLNDKWGERDNLTLFNGADNDQKKDGFKGFVGVPKLNVDGGKAVLEYIFETERSFSALNARVAVGNAEAYTTDAIALGGGKYSVSVGIASPLRYSDTAEVTIYDGETPISQTAGYSVNRAAGFVGQFGSAEQKPAVEALWSLGKAASWYADRDLVTYTLQIGNGSLYRFSLGEYGAYSVATDKTVTDGRWGAGVYACGMIADENNLSAENIDKGIAIAYDKSEKTFDVSLDGAEIDTLNARNAAEHTLTVNVGGDSHVNGSVSFGDYHWNEWGGYWSYNSPASVYADCDVVITGDRGAKLTVCGNVYAAGKLTVDGAAVEIIVKDAIGADGLVCGALEIVNGGSVTVRYDGLGASERSAVNASGDVTVDGALDIYGFVNGVYLSSDDAAQTFTVDGGTVDINVSGYGITSADAFIGADGDRTRVNKELRFNGGTTSIFTGNGTVDSAGISGGNVTVDDATLNVIADSGYCIEAKNPVAFRTTSGDHKKGKVVLVNSFFNQWYDVNYALKVKTLELDGGNVYAYAMCRGGVIHTEADATIVLKNCDLTVKNGQDVTDVVNRGFGIDLGGGNEMLTVERSARVFFESVAAALRCWGRTEANAPEIVNNGVIVLDNFAVGLEPWIWSMTYSFTNNGQIHGANQISQ